MVDPRIKWPVQARHTFDPELSFVAEDDRDLGAGLEYWNCPECDADEWELTDADGRRLVGRVEHLSVVYLLLAEESAERLYSYYCSGIIDSVPGHFQPGSDGGLEWIRVSKHGASVTTEPLADFTLYLNDADFMSVALAYEPGCRPPSISQNQVQQDFASFVWGRGPISAAIMFEGDMTALHIITRESSLTRIASILGPPTPDFSPLNGGGRLSDYLETFHDFLVFLNLWDPGKKKRSNRFSSCLWPAGVLLTISLAGFGAAYLIQLLFR